MEKLSSRLTAWWKIWFPIWWIGGFLATDIMIFTGAFDAAPPYFRIIFPAVTIAGSVFIWWACLRLKVVSKDDEDLVIGNFRRTARVPLSEVLRVTQVPFLSPVTVVIEFKSPTTFGRSIRFIPRSGWEGPAVGAIREAAGQESAERQP